VMPPVLLDPFWVDSALTNLVANALRLTPSGGSVQVRVEDHGPSVDIAVTDTGPGIAPEDQAKVFERFAQGDSSKRVIGGTGIGLALVREAARLHGGDVALESELGKGSTFTIALPRRALPAGAKPTSIQPKATLTGRAPGIAPPPQVDADARDGGALADRPSPIPGAPLAIVVEDNPDLRTFIADVLSAKYQVRGAMDGAEGLQLARKLRPDVIVSDVAMPGMDGYALCRAVRADNDTRGIPILLVTARTEMSSVLEGFEAGASDYLLKPFHATELLARVDVHVRLRRLSGQLARHERLAALGTLAASIAHNVRNPLSALISGLPAVRSRLASVMDSGTSDFMAIMLECAERIERITLDLLDLSRLDREESGEFAPGKGLLACTRMVIPRLTLGIELRSEVDDKAQISGRAGDVNHAFMNVVDNALRAVGQNGRVEVRGWVEGDAYIVTVADSGPGVDAGLADRIFEPFFTTRSNAEGTGLGLSIARQIMEEHGGSISVGRSPELGGAVFTMRLPLRSAARAVA
ncbi:MAG TPA: ATP-binding protein, partial [Polyangiales bacterium]|nr:ATP-binding protein [Polyangiales bacterium]